MISIFASLIAPGRFPRQNLWFRHLLKIIAPGISSKQMAIMVEMDKKERIMYQSSSRLSFFG